MLLHLYHTRFSEQIETADAETIVAVAVKTAKQLDNPLIGWRNECSRARFSISVR
jgi:hypothetical protein